MYAIVEIAGKQFRVEKDQNIKVPLLPAENGSKVVFDRVLFYTDDSGENQIGAPLVKNMQVAGTVLEHGRDKKIIVFKKKRRKGYQVKNGHRQDFSLIKIDDISAAKAKAKKAAEPAKEKTEPVKKSAAKKETTAKTKTSAPKKTTAAKKATAKTAVKAEPKIKTKTETKKPAEGKEA